MFLLLISASSLAEYVPGGADLLLTRPELVLELPTSDPPAKDNTMRR